MSSPHTPSDSPLGKSSAYEEHYNPGLLFPLPRADKRAELGLAATGTLPFFGMDVWNAYEVSWLNMRGKPQVAIATMQIPADSPNIIESKSMKLYFNSFNQSKVAGPEALVELLRTDLSNAVGSSVQVKLTLPEDFGKERMAELEGLNLDRMDIDCERYTPAPEFLVAAEGEPGLTVMEVAKMNLIEGIEVQISGSIGISIFPRDGMDMQSLVNAADNAMYHAKQSGKNNWQFYSAELSGRVHAQMSLQDRVRGALKRDEFSLVFQPVLDSLTGTTTGVEALVRWHREDAGQISPAVFVPIAERSGLIVDLDLRWDGPERRDVVAGEQGRDDNTVR